MFRLSRNLEKYVNDYKEIIQNLMIKVYLERVAECDTK